MLDEKEDTKKETIEPSFNATPLDARTEEKKDEKHDEKNEMSDKKDESVNLIEQIGELLAPINWKETKEKEKARKAKEFSKELENKVIFFIFPLYFSHADISSASSFVG